jgi:hypothetical protein
VLYDDFLFPPTDRPVEDRILNEVVALTLRGIECRDGSSILLRGMITPRSAGSPASPDGGRRTRAGR